MHSILIISKINRGYYVKEIDSRTIAPEENYTPNPKTNPNPNPNRNPNRGGNFPRGQLSVYQRNFTDS